jgi:hypothetical protein
MHYQIEYYNKLWKDWLAFDQLFYQTEQQAQKVADKNKQYKTRIISTNILNEKSKRFSKRNLGTKVSAEKA